MCDGYGIVQFMRAIAEMADGAHAPSVLPVWQRTLLNARDPPIVTYPHHEYDQVEDTNTTKIALNDMAHHGMGEVDFGWGKPINDGPAMGGVGMVPGLISYFIPFNNRVGEKGIVVPICLPTPAMHGMICDTT